MVEHILKLRKLQEELHLMENMVSDEDFVMILITSLPESWDNYTSLYLGASRNKLTLKSHELVAILIEEYCHRQGQNYETAGGLSMQARHQQKGKKNTSSQGKKKTDVEHYCHKKGHMSSDHWAKGGGHEGQGPKGC